jgi:uncharacterized protein involved in exopolysaccharide biosynthesis
VRNISSLFVPLYLNSFYCMTQNQPNEPQNQPNLNLRSTLLVLRDYLIELLRKWYWFLLLGAIAVFAASYYVQKLQTTYQANSSMMLSTETGGGISGILRMAGQFGVGAAAGGSELSSEKLMDLLSSRQIVYSSLLKTVEIDGKKNLLANHIVSILYNKPNAIKNTSIEKLTPTENELLMSIYSSITNGALISNVGRSGVVHITFDSSSEKVAKETLQVLVTTLRDYYTDKAIEQQRLTYNIINDRVDSLEKALYSTEYNMAHFIDEYRPALRAGSLSAQKLMTQDQLKRQAEILNVMYAEAAKNREIAQMSMLSNRPIVQIVDLPAYPLDEKKPNIIIIYVLALFLTLGVVTILVVLNKLVRDALKQQP